MNEQNIANTLITILTCGMNSNSERQELYSFKNEVVHATFYEGYTWREPDKPDVALLEIAPEGITCFVRIPSSMGHEREPYELTYYIFNLGRNVDGSYDSGNYQFFATAADSVEMLLGYFFTDEEQPPRNSLHEFTFYFP